MDVFIVTVDRGNDDEPRTSVIVKAFNDKDKADEFIRQEVKSEAEEAKTNGEKFNRDEFCQRFSVRRITVE